MLLKKYIVYIKYSSSKPILLIFLAVIILALSFPIRNIHIDGDGKGWLPKGSNKLFYKNLYQEKFGSDEVVVVYLTFPDSSTSTYHQQKLKEIADSVEMHLNGFQTVFSNYSIDQLEHLVGNKYASRMKDAYFNSKDSVGEMLFLTQKSGGDIIKNRPLLIDSLRITLTNILPVAVKVDITGQGVVFDEINRLSTTDSVKLFIICFLLIILLLWWQVRKFRYLLLSLGLIVFSIIPSLSLFSWLNVPFNMITMTVPLLFAINFSSYAIHFITKETTDIDQYLLKKIPPVFTSALASIIGFGSLAINNIQIISRFGLLSSLGILVGLLVLLFAGVPVTVYFIRINRFYLNSKTINDFLERYYKIITRRLAVVVFTLVVGLSVIAIVVFPKIEVDTNMIHFMKSKNSVRQSIEYIQDHYGAANLVEMLVHKTNGEVLTNADLKKVHQLTLKLDSLTFANHVVDYQLWQPVIAKSIIFNPVLARSFSKKFITEDHKFSQITFNLPTGTVHEMKLMLIEIDRVIKEELIGTSIEVNPAGFLPLYIEQMDTIVGGMLSGLALAVVLILLVMIVLVRNIKLGLITIFITIFPLFVLGVIMKVFHIPFDVGTSIIFSVIIGMIADDALHIIWNFKQHQLMNTDQTINELFANSVRKIIYPCMVTSIMFSVGFSVLGFSNISIITNFGILSTATILLAWFSDFILLPAFLNLFYSSKSKSIK
ncbi:MAG: RND family transporter [Prolixibacteraceae bacterium]